MLNVDYSQIVNICSTYLDDPSVKLGVMTRSPDWPPDFALHTLVPTLPLESPLPNIVVISIRPNINIPAIYPEPRASVNS